MQVGYERQGKVEMIDREPHLFSWFEDEAVPDPHQVERPDCEMRQDCDGCGEFFSHVDLFAEDSETGEQLWLCESCVDW